MFFFATTHEMFSNSSENFHFDIMPLKADGWTFDMRKSDFESYSNPYLALSARTGDLNLVRIFVAFSLSVVGFSISSFFVPGWLPRHIIKDEIIAFPFERRTNDSIFC